MNCRDFIYAASAGTASAAMPAATVAQGNRESRSDGPRTAAKLRTITLEEHFVSPGFVAGPGKDFTEALQKRGAGGVRILKQLQDVGDGRIAEMDAAGIDMQVLSLNAPGVEQADVAEQVAIARESNDFLADIVKKNPKRFAGFAALPVAAPEQAADELDRRVRQQGFKGTLINGHTRGRYLDDKFFSPILERAEALNVPIYLHPTVPPKAVADVLYGGFSPAVSASVRGLRLGLAHRDGGSPHSHDPRRGVRPSSQASSRGRASGRGASLHAAEAQQEHADAD